jgi:hypothetical protein
MSTIPVNTVVSVQPNVLGTGGSAVDTIGLVCTQSTRVPIGTVAPFPNATSVGDFFGLASHEYNCAEVYFQGFDNSNVKPGSVLFAQYNGAVPVAAYLRGGDIAAEGLTALQQIASGTLTVVMDGYTHTAASINLTGATSFSNAAGLIQTALDPSEPTEASFTSALGAAITASMGSSCTTSTTTGTTLTLGALASGYLSVGDLVSGTDSTNSLPAGCHILAQLTGTPGGSAGATFTISAAATPGNMTSATVTGTSTIMDATVDTGYISIGDTITGTTVPTNTTVLSQLTGTTGGVGTYQLSCTAQGIASESMLALSTVLDVTVCATPNIAVGQTLVGSSVTGTPVITAQISGTAGGVGFYRINGSQQHVVSESMTTVATAPTVTFDSTSGAFVVTSGITGTPSTAAFATGSLNASLLLTSATGAVLSQGAAATTPSAFMTGITQINTDWATFMLAFDPDNGSGNAQKLLFIEWTSLQNDQFGFVCWDTDVTPTTQVPATSSLGYLIQQNDYSGTCLVWEPSDLLLAPFVCGMAASIDFTETNGRITFAFKHQAGLTPTVTNATVAANLIANGYNFYGAYAAATQPFMWFNPGSVSGPFLWFDSYINQIWLNSYFQIVLANLLNTVKSIPYNTVGYLTIEAACQDVINAGLNFGAFVPGVTLSAAQIAEVNAAAGANIAPTLSQRGWYLQVSPASPSVRAARGSPGSTFWYCDGQSVQKIALTSVNVQ